MQEKEKDIGILNNGKMEKENFWGDENWEREWWRRIKRGKTKICRKKFFFLSNLLELLNYRLMWPTTFYHCLPPQLPTEQLSYSNKKLIFIHRLWIQYERKIQCQRSHFFPLLSWFPAGHHLQLRRRRRCRRRRRQRRRRWRGFFSPGLGTRLMTAR